MKVNVLGDVHAQVYDCLENLKPNTIQVGDLNILGYDKKSWFKRIKNDDKELTEYPYSFKFPMVFIDGNHDYFSSFNPDGESIQNIEHNLFYIPRGYISGSVLFLGGSESIDKNTRTSGRDWFPEESITQRQIYRITNMERMIEVVISHDCPYSFIDNHNPTFDSPSKRALEVILKRFKPRLWIFGHHHRSFNEEWSGCHFIGLNIAEKLLIDLPLEEDFFSSLKNDQKNNNEKEKIQNTVVKDRPEVPPIHSG